jgi:hypothetical protein
MLKAFVSIYIYMFIKTLNEKFQITPQVYQNIYFQGWCFFLLSFVLQHLYSFQSHYSQRMTIPLFKYCNCFHPIIQNVSTLFKMYASDVFPDGG